MNVAGLFAGIGGIELGLHRAGFETVLLSEIDESAGSVLRRRFPVVRFSFQDPDLAIRVAAID